jgi:hypothetical protein
MISHQHSANASSSSAGQPSSFPPYPYAHLYPQQQQQQQQLPPPQPHASSSRHQHVAPRTPHSHHGHGSGSGFAHNVPHQYQQPPQPASQSPWSGTLPPTTASPAPTISHASKAQKAWWSHFNFVRAMKKEGNAGDSGGVGGYQGEFPRSLCGIFVPCSGWTA